MSRKRLNLALVLFVAIVSIGRCALFSQKSVPLCPGRSRIPPAPRFRMRRCG